jgi:hypothetical protein
LDGVQDDGHMTHDRTLFHYGVEDTTTAVLASPVGQYPTGTDVQTVLEGFAARLTFIEGNPFTTVTGFTADSVIKKAQSTTITADAYILFSRVTTSFTADAWIKFTFTINAYLVDRVGGGTTLAAPVTTGASVITVTDPSTFPSTNGFIIEINGTQYTVTAGAGTTTWTISPVAATNYSSGTAVTEIC